jgi:predicted signal transduction protein with EAL and GGDEF domain
MLGPFPAYKILQHTSSFAGLVVIAWSIIKLPVTNAYRKEMHTVPFWSSIFIIAVIITLLRILLVKERLIIGNLVTTTILSFLLALTMVAYFFERKKTSP